MAAIQTVVQHHRLASSERTVYDRPSLATVIESRYSARRTGPDGVLHGHAPKGDHTVCGLPVRALYDWPERAWPPPRDSRGAVCAACRRNAGD